MHILLEHLIAEKAHQGGPRARDTRWRDQLRGTNFQKFLLDA